MLRLLEEELDELLDLSTEDDSSSKQKNLLLDK
jgi:hypothetical protein